MVIRVRCRRSWLSALMRSLRNEVVPLSIRRHLIVVDQPKHIQLQSEGDLTRII